VADTILSGDITLYKSTENGQQRIAWTGSSSGKRTVNELYSALRAWEDNLASMGQKSPIVADTPTIYRIRNQWFIDDTTVEHLTGGSLYTLGWVDGTDEHVLIIGYDPATAEFNEVDIGRTILGTSSGDTGTILDFNSTRNLLWIRPDDASATGDEFDNGIEAYTLGVATNGDPITSCFVEDNGTSFTDETTDINSGAANDVEFPAAEAINDAIYFGFEQKFSRLKANVGTAGDATGVVIWEYSRGGDSWGNATALITDSTTGLETAGTNNVSWDATPPADWATDSVSASAQLYWLRVRVTTVFDVTNPKLTQAWISGVGEGTFANHNRHGVGSAAGESAWVGLTTKGTLEGATHQYISQQDPDRIAADSEEVLVVATKGASDWWNNGAVDILLKVKEADNVIGQLPNSSPATAVATVFARQYTKNYAHSIETGLQTAGGNVVAPLSTTDDGDNPLGYGNLVWDNGDAGATLVDEELLYIVGAAGAGNLEAGVQDDGGVFSDDTTDLNSIGAGDVAVYTNPATVEDAFYFGMDDLFNLLMLDVGTAHNGTTSTQVWEYWNGTAWTALSGVVDDTDAGEGAFETVGRGLVSWTLPVDWTRTNVANQPAAAAANLFYVRIRISILGNLTTEPVLDTAWASGEAQLKARVADASITTPGGATGNADYYLVGDPLVDFSNNDVVIAGTSRKNFDINGAPTDATGGPAADETANEFTLVHGQFTRDIDENAAVDPYSIDVQNPNSRSVQRLYEWTKYKTRRGETNTTDTDGQQGQFWIGSEIQLEYSGQAGGAFAQGTRVYDQTTNAEAVIVADHDDGATGDLIVRTLRGTFTAGNVISDSPETNQAMNTDAFLYVVSSAGAIVDESVDALSGTAADVTLTMDTIADYVAVGATRPFSKIVFNNVGGTAGTVGVIAWEYWNGTAWTDLETGFNFVDGTGDFKNAPADGQNVTFDPPVGWRPRGLSDGTVNSAVLYWIRARATTAFTIQPVYDDVQVEDRVTATLASTRAIAAIASAPFGTYPGASKMFMAPGMAPTSTQMATGEEQEYSTIDDNGATRNPPNKQNVTSTNLISGDTVTVHRLTGAEGEINTAEFTLAANNDQGDITIVVGAAIAADHPSVAGSKIRVESADGSFHRYRYASFSGSTFTLDAAKTGTSDGGNSDTNTLHDTTGTFTTAPAIEVGDYVRNTTEDVFVRVLSITSATQLETETLPGGGNWSGDSYAINSLVEDYATGADAYVPLIERISDATSESATLTYVADIELRYDVRRNAATAILPFTQDATFGSTSGASIATIRTTDTITT